MSEDDYALLLRYCHETGFTITMEELYAMPHHKAVWGWWKALGHYRLNNHYQALDEAPEGLQWVTVMGADVKRSYRWENGKYVFVQEMTKEAAKDIYGK